MAKEPWDMTYEERQAEIEHITKEKASILNTNLLSEGTISPSAVATMPKYRREQWQRDGTEKLCLEARLRELRKSDHQLEMDKKWDRQKRMEKARSDIGTIEHQIRFYTGIGMGKRGKVKPSYQRVIDEYEEEKEKIYEEFPELREE